RRISSQIALRYLVQQGIIPIPRTANPGHLAANLAVFDFKLSDAEMAELGKLKRSDGRVGNPPPAPQWDSWSERIEPEREQNTLLRPAPWPCLRAVIRIRPVRTGSRRILSWRGATPRGGASRCAGR